MKQFLWRLLKYGFGFAIALPLAFILSYEYLSFDFKKNLRIKTFGYLRARLSDIDTIKNVDVLVLGTSHAYRAVDPRNFKRYKVFTLASSAQSPLQSRFFIKRHVEKLNPDLVLWEVYNNTFTGDGLESSIDIAANIKLDDEAWNYLLAQNEVRVYLSLLNNWYDDSPIIIQYEEGNSKYIPGGFVERLKKKYYSHKMMKNVTPSEFSFDEKQTLAFEDGIRLLMEMNTKVFLFRTPFTKSFYKNYTNQEEIDAYFESVVRRYELSGYINFNKVELNLVDSLHFYDENHLNQSGADRLDVELEKIIDSLLSETKPRDVLMTDR